MRQSHKNESDEFLATADSTSFSEDDSQNTTTEQGQDPSHLQILRQMGTIIDLESWHLTKTVLSWFVTGVVAFSLFALGYVALRQPYVELPSAGEEIVFYSDHTRDHLSHVMLSAIKRAKKNIYIEIYSMTDSKVLKLLSEKAKAGVTISILTDRHYIAQTRSKLPKSVQIKASSTKGLMHRKIVILDDAWVWLGSANFTWQSLNMYHNLLMGVHSPVLASFLTDPSAPQEGRILVSGQHLDLWNLPHSHSGVEAMIEAIDNARSIIQVAMFTWTRTDLVEALVRAKRRGVTIEVILDRKASLGASKNIYETLLAKKIPTQLSAGAQLMHHKCLLIDEKEFFFGSVNWTEGGFNNNRDILLRLPLLTTTQEEKLKAMWKQLWNDSI